MVPLATGFKYQLKILTAHTYIMKICARYAQPLSYLNHTIFPGGNGTIPFPLLHLSRMAYHENDDDDDDDNDERGICTGSTALKLFSPRRQWGLPGWLHAVNFSLRIKRIRALFVVMML